MTTAPEVQEKWTITYTDADGRRQVRYLGTPGADRTAEQQCSDICDQLRAGGATRLIVDIQRTARSYTVEWQDIRGRSASRQFDELDEATTFAAEKRLSPWIGPVAVRHHVARRPERRAVLKETGRPT